MSYNSRHSTSSETLHHDSLSQESQNLIPSQSIKPKNVKQSRSCKASKIGLFISVCINIILISAIVLGTIKFKQSDTVLINSPTGLKYDHTTEYQFNNPYWNASDAVTDAHWDDISTDPVVVAIPDTWALQHNLPLSARWPWDATRGRYFIRAFHELHCLKYIRRYLTTCIRTNEAPHDLIPQHVLHCMDTIRQSIMCRADDTLEPTSDETSYRIGDHELHQCRSLEKLTEWALSPERHACHRSLSDYRPVKHQIERFAFCPEGSPYQEVVDSYFEEHGHRDPWE